jgi:hypothetical protein
MLKYLSATVALLACFACNKGENLSQVMSDCQCQKFDALAKAIDENPDEAKNKAISYMTEIIECAVPHVEAFKKMSEEERKQLQIDVDKAVAAKCADSKKKLKSL